jgi:hypothetical protein
MQNENELPKDLSTAHDVIVMQSAFLKEQASRIDRLEKDLAEAHAAFKKLLAGNRSEKYINPDQRKRTERSELVCPVGGGRLGVAEHPREHFALRVANDR